jgi:hypothetical protein
MKTQAFGRVALCGWLAAAASAPVSGLAAEPATTPAITNQPVPVTAKSNLVVSGPRDRRPVRLSVGLDDVVKLVKAGVDESVVLAFIQSSPVAYHPSAQEIIRLRELGISSPVITAMLQRGEEIRVRAAEARREMELRNAPTPQPAPPVADPPNGTSAPAPSAPPTVVYAASSYTYPPVVSYAYGPSYYPRSYSYYPRAGYYGSHFPRASFSVGFHGGHGGIRFGGLHGGVHFGGRGGFRHCR